MRKFLIALSLLAATLAMAAKSPMPTYMRQPGLRATDTGTVGCTNAGYTGSGPCVRQDSPTFTTGITTPQATVSNIAMSTNTFRMNLVSPSPSFDFFGDDSLAVFFGPGGNLSSTNPRLRMNAIYSRYVFGVQRADIQGSIELMIPGISTARTAFMVGDIDTSAVMYGSTGFWKYFHDVFLDTAHINTLHVAGNAQFDVNLNVTASANFSRQFSSVLIGGGLATSSPISTNATLEIEKNTAAIISLVGNGGQGGLVEYRTARGTKGSLTATQSGDALAQHEYFVYDGSAFGDGFYELIAADGTANGSNHAANKIIYGVVPGATSLTEWGAWYRGSLRLAVGAGTGNRPACFTSTGVIYAGTNTVGTLACP